MLKLATHVVKDGPFAARDAAGWVVRLCATLIPIHERGLFHGRISTKAAYVAFRDADAEAVLLDYEELPSDLAFHSRARLGGAGPSAEDDVWAAGVFLYQLLTGLLPFEGASPSALKKQMDTAPPAPLAVFDVGDDRLQEVLDRIFQPDAQSVPRIDDAASLREALIAWNETLARLPPFDVGAEAMIEVEEDDDDPTSVFDPSNDPGVAAVLERARRERRAQAPGKPAEEGPASAPSVDADEAVDPAAAEGSSPPEEEAVEPPPDDPAPSEEGPPSREEGDGDEAPGPLSERGPSPPAGVAAASTAEAEAPRSGSPPAPARSSRSGLVAAIGLLCVAAGGYGALSLFGSPPSDEHPPAPSAAPPKPVEAAPPSHAPRGETSAPPPRRPPPPTTSSTAPPPAARPSAPSAAPSVDAPSPTGDVFACVVPLLAEDTFGTSRPDLGFVCEGSDPIEGMKRLRKEVVIAGHGRGTTDGKREWSELRWYMMAAFAIARQHCCEAPAPLKTSTQLSECKFDERVANLARAVETGQEAPATKALDEYTEAIRCLDRAGARRAFGQSTEPTSIGLRAFRRVFRRALAAAQ